MDSQPIIKTSFNIKPSDGIFRNTIIKSIGSNNMTLLQQISKDNGKMDLYKSLHIKKLTIFLICK